MLKSDYGYSVLALEKVGAPPVELPIIGWHFPDGSSRPTPITLRGEVPWFLVGDDLGSTMFTLSDGLSYGGVAYVIAAPGGVFLDREGNKLDGMPSVEASLAKQVEAELADRAREKERESEVHTQLYEEEIATLKAQYEGEKREFEIAEREKRLLECQEEILNEIRLARQILQLRFVQQKNRNGFLGKIGGVFIGGLVSVSIVWLLLVLL